MSGPSYDPLPLGTDHRDDGRYDIPMSPRMSTHPSEMEPLGPHDGPRFLGAALHDDGPQPRQSYADSNSSFPTLHDDYQSVRALDPANQAGAAGDKGFYTLNYHDDPHDADFNDSTNTFVANAGGMQSSPYLSEKRGAYPTPKPRSRRRMWIFGGIAVAAIVIIVVVVVVVVLVAHNKSSDDKDSVSGGSAKDSSKPSGTTSSSAAQASATSKTTQNLIVTGGDGSTVTMEDGTTFVYSNSFGGTWYWDPNDPFNNGARAQKWSPALNETFNYGVDKIRGYVRRVGIGHPC